MQPARRSIGALATLAAAACCLVAPATVATAAGSFCSGQASGDTTIMWTGGGNGHSWTDEHNWSPATVPDVHQTAATYQPQFVCIGDDKGGGAATATIPGGDTFHVAGIAVGHGAHLTVKPGGGLFLGAARGSPVASSSVEAGSQLQLDAAVLGGNSPLTVSGSLRWTGQLIDHHREVATQTSSECAFDPSIPACPGETTPGGGRTVIASGGSLLVDGTTFGGTDLGDGRVIDNFGTITLTHAGYVAMNDGTELIDEPRSSLRLDGQGGLFRGAKQSGATAATIRQRGAIVRDGEGNNGAVIALPLVVGTHKPAISVLGGSLALSGSIAPTASADRATRYGLGSCGRVTIQLCTHPYASPAQRQMALLGTSSESASPKVSRIGLSLVAAPAKLHGHPVLGRAVKVTAPTKKTSHSVHLTFVYDATTAGLTPSVKPIVYRNKHAITLCKVHGLTAKNTSCLLSADVSHSGQGTKGDLTVVLITIQPDARWLVARST